MNGTFNTIKKGDCIKGMNALPEGSVDLVFADPPFNIGFEYDKYDDSKGYQEYLEWSDEWIGAVYRVLKEDGTFWLAIGDEYAAELKVASRKIGFHCRSWVVWYYTFGVNCSKKFTRSHAHLFYFTKAPDKFTFRDDDLENRIPSARQLVYKDKRANPKGRLPDDTWLIQPADAVGTLTDDSLLNGNVPSPSDDGSTWTLRPQELDQCFQPKEDTWHFPRVAGTFKERAGFHGCQMPEQLLGRIIRTCSSEGELVLDPFSGSATTLAVAKKLGRQFLGFDISPDYIKHGRSRLKSIRCGDPLNGSPEPNMTNATKMNKASVEAGDAPQVIATLEGVVEAFKFSHDGFSADRVIADPTLNDRFAERCEYLGLVGDRYSWNKLLLHMRKKKGGFGLPKTTVQTDLSWNECDRYLFASEIALQELREQGAASLDDIFCNPKLASSFDQRAIELGGADVSAFHYRWAALHLRKHAKVARSRAEVLAKAQKSPQFTGEMSLADFIALEHTDGPGVYLLTATKSKALYVGGALNMSKRIQTQFDDQRLSLWQKYSKSLRVQTLVNDDRIDVLAWQSRCVKKFAPALNYVERRSAS